MGVVVVLVVVMAVNVGGFWLVIEIVVNVVHVDCCGAGCCCGDGCRCSSVACCRVVVVVVAVDNGSFWLVVEVVVVNGRYRCG